MVQRRGPYQDVRSLTRGLRLLEALGQAGWIKPAALGEVTGIDRSSTYRLLHTLAECGYVKKREDDGSFALSEKINLLADGFTQADRTSQIVAGHLQALTADISWPSDFAVLRGGEVIIVESTHRLSPMSLHRAMIGKKRPLMMSALGRAIISAMTPDELDISLRIVTQLGGPDAAVARNPALVDKIVQEVNDRGFASATGSVDMKVSSIALPVRGPNSVIGAVNIIFFRKALTISEAADRYLAKLRFCVDRIMNELSNKELEASLARSSGEPRVSAIGLRSPNSHQFRL